ncbi:MAG TPA: SAM-dependent chlorinase/fluorinase, partial [Thermoplasmata archaeon]|nr:SAM-dependent chlorinase/fluorinase [Thermoplasmata archaeon]
LRPHALGEAAFVVRAMAARFPAGTVHIVVVDPGVGGRRASIVVACRDGSVLVGPDNGVLGPLCDALGGGTAFRIDPTRLDAAPRVGTTFDGRDVFAPAAAQIATGTDPGALGPPIGLRRLPVAGPKRTATGANGSVLHIDRFGNLVTDVPTSWVPRGTSSVGVRLGRVRRRVAFVTSYEQGGRGRLLALGSSFGTLELAVGAGRAADRARAGVGSRAGFAWTKDPARPARRKR